MADDPWAAFNPQPAPAAAAPADDPWAQFNPKPATEEPRGVVGNLTRPFTSLWSNIQDVNREGRQHITEGIEALSKPTGGDLAESAKAAVKGVAGIGGGAIQSAISPVTGTIRSFLSKPLEETTGIPKEWTEFGTELLVPGIGLTRPPRIPFATRVPKKGPEAEAGRLLEYQIQKEGGDPEAVRQAVQGPPEEIVPGSKPTTFQQSGDLGAGQVERGATTRHPAAFQERFGEQNAARLEAIEKLQPAGSPQDAASKLRQVMEAETQAAEAAVLQAQRDADQAAAAMGGRHDPTTYGNIMRRGLEDAEEVTRAYERTLWQRIDPNLPANPQPVQELERRIYGSMMEGGAAEASLSPMERQISEVIQNYPPQGIPFQELRQLRTLVSGELRKELVTNGQTGSYARLSQLRGGIEDAIAQSVPPEVYDQVRAATQATAQRAQTFRAEGVKQATRKEMGGVYKMGEASVPGTFIQPGAKGYDTASNYLRAVGQPGLEDFTDAVAATARREVIGPDGAINPRKLEGWTKRYQDVLRAIDERDGGAFSARLRNMGTAQDTLDTAVARQTAVAKQQGKDAFANIIGATNDADITRMVAEIFGKTDSTQRMAELMRRLGGDQAAIDGARRAVAEHLRTRLLSNMEAAATGKPIIRAEQFQNFVKHNIDALKQIMSPEQVQSLQNIARDIQQRSNRTVQTGIRGRSTSEQDRRIMREQEESGLKTGAKQVGKLAGKSIIDTIAAYVPFLGPLAVRSGEAVIASRIAKWKAKGLETIQDLVDEAMLNPEVARELLSKSYTTKIKPGIRAPYQAGGGVPAIGGTAGRPAREAAPVGFGGAREGPGEALSDGGAPTYAEGGEVKAGSREQLGSLLSSSIANVSGQGGQKQKMSAPQREDIIRQLKSRGLPTGGWEAPTGTEGESHVPFVESRAEGGEVHDPWGLFADGGDVPLPRPDPRPRPRQEQQPSEKPYETPYPRIIPRGSGGMQDGGEVDEQPPAPAPEPEKPPLPDSIMEAWEGPAARVRRRYPVREPDPVSLKASGVPGTRGMPFSHWLPSEERARAASESLMRGEDYDPRDAFLSSIGVVGSPVGTAVRGAGTVLGSGAVRAAKEKPGALWHWAETTPRAPEPPVLLGNPELRGSMSTTENVPFTYRGKGPAEWTPEEYQQVGEHFGVPGLGPESPPQAFQYADQGAFNIPGGLEGKFTYYDLLRMKAEGIDPSRIPRDVHTQLHQKLMRSMDVEQPVSPERTWSGLMFGMTSPNNPLFPNQLTQSILRMREPGLRQQLADQIPWQVGDKVSKEERLAASDRIADMFGLSASGKGGLGIRGSTDYSRIGELAQMWERNPQWFTKTPEESWPNYVERLTSQVTGTSMKTGSFGGVWQDPAHAGISAIDRHMIHEFERTGQLFPSPAEQKAFEQRAVERWNNANPDNPMRNYRDLEQRAPESHLTKMKLEYVGNEQFAKLRTPKGEFNPRVPEHLQRTDWPSEPSHVKLMGDAYRRALDWNQQLATQHGLDLFPSQWLEWDRIRRRFEPHENMFPGLERMPAMSREQLRGVSAEHTASGHKTYGKVESETEEGQMNLQPTRPRPNPGQFAYFQMPPIGGLPGILRRVYGDQQSGP